jgi:hypothetical protein
MVDGIPDGVIEFDLIAQLELELHFRPVTNQIPCSLCDLVLTVDNLV